MLRLDRFMTLYYFRPLRELGSGKGTAIPILMYHSISEAHEAAHPYYRVNTSPKMFADQMRFLAAQGYRTITLQELTNNEPVGKSVVITFDDGFSDFYFNANPILKEHGFRATVFLVTASVGESFNGRRCLDWGQIRELYAAGVTFGSHSHTHRQLRYLDRSAIVEELRRSKGTIEDKLGCAVIDFSYPYRFPEENREFKGLISEELTNAGYARCVTTIIGRYRSGDDPMLIKRLPVNSSDDASFLDAKLNGSYDWLHVAQVAIKRLRGLLSWQC
jgi:peptidoglycan/xylan/chitin deacetylase (PgdA/CDA1 family)